MRTHSPRAAIKAGTPGYSELMGSAFAAERPVSFLHGGRDTRSRRGAGARLCADA